MDKSIKKMWVAALRSGEYRQTKGVLHLADGSFCALGVLTDLDKRVQWERATFDPDILCAEEDGGETALPPERIREAASLAAWDVNRVIILNDRHGLSFDEIADWIEENL